jgi:hypothetical protein
MKSKENNLESFRFSDQRQARIYRRLLLIGPGAAAFYQDACRLMKDSVVLSTTHLVSHLLREIESSLRNVLKPFIKSDEKAPKGEIHIWQIREIIKGLDISETDPVAQAWLRLPDSDYGLHKRAHREDLAAPRALDDDYRRFWNEMESILDVVLEKFEGQYLESHHRLDELLTKEEPANEDAQWLRLNTPNNLVSLGYFFNKLTNPKWLRPLIAEGLFRHPPEPERELKDDRILINYSPWSQSRYLVRMAATDSPDVQQMVFDVLHGIDTENFLIHLDIIDAACTLPADLAAQLAAKEIRWVEQQNSIDHLLPDKMASLINHLAAGGQSGTAQHLAHTLLAVLPNPGVPENEIVAFALDPITKVGLWDYERIIGRCRATLAEADGQTTLALFTDLLETAIKLSHPEREQTGKEDYSEIWRRGIEGYEGGLKNLLVSAIRDTAEQIIKSDSYQLFEVIGFLESRRWLIFKRLALHLLRLFPENADAFIVERLTNKDNFSERELWHEYIVLAREYFPSLAIEQQNIILGWIDEAPDVETVIENRKHWDGRVLSDEEAEQSIKWRKLKQIEPLRDVLPPEWKARYDDWTAELGRPEHAEYTTSPVQFRAGYGSPRTTEDLRSMSVEEIVSFLSEWQPADNNPFDSSPEGLGREITSLVSSMPEKFAAAAESFQGLEPTYVRSFLSGINGAMKQSLTFEWIPILNLCRWVISQSNDTAKTATGYRERDENWTATRAEIADLLSAGLNTEPLIIPFDFRLEVWNILRPLTDDPQPTPEFEKEYGSNNMDPLTLSMNTVRGEALRTLMKYALWVRHHTEKTDDSGERLARGFEEMPEVREVLNLHLNLEYDSSLAVRAVYGDYLPWLILLDQSWVRENLAKIFPKEENFRTLQKAAWGTYMFNEPYDNAFELLQEEYKIAIESMGAESVYDNSHLTHPDNRLVYHLIRLYLREKLNLDDPQSLFNLFYETASDQLRAYVFSSLGRDFQQTEFVPPEILEKVKRLVDYRVNKARDNPAEFKAEMEAFGWLFASKKFDELWSITTLKETLDTSGYSEFDNLVIEYLADLAADFPALAIECITILIDGVDNQWTISYWSPHIKKVISAAIKTDSRSSAIVLINKLGSRGHLEFQELL